MPVEFLLEFADSSGARAGVIETAHARLETPYFQPVATAGAIKGLSWRTMKAIGYPHVLMNTYHLALRPGVEKIAAAGGMREFSGWDGGILTDSGGYQVFSLAKMRKIEPGGVTFMSHIDGSTHVFTPESVVEAQRVFGSDIMMPLDICSPANSPNDKAAADLELTNKWLKKAAKAWAKTAADKSALFGIVQGAMHKDLRVKSAKFAAKLDLPGYAVGGLSVGEADDVFADTAEYSAGLLPENKPRYLMGVGTPADLVRAIGWGYDMFDCVLPTRMARHHVAYTRTGRLDLRRAVYSGDERPLDEKCGCPVCKDHTRAYLWHLAKLNEINAPVLLTLHNLYFYREIMRKARAAIIKGNYAKFARAALKEMGEWRDELDESKYGGR